MKLTDPDDHQLNASFAEKVAGYTFFMSKNGHYIVTPPDGKNILPMYDAAMFDEFTGIKIERNWWDGVDLPYYVESMDAVLPYLEEHGWKGTSNRSGNTCMATVSVVLPSSTPETTEVSAHQDWNQTQYPLPRAAVVALLRAHGIEIEFS